MNVDLIFNLLFVASTYANMYFLLWGHVLQELKNSESHHKVNMAKSMNIRRI